MQVTLEDAYREACLGLGEAVVRERLLVAELARRDAEVQRRDQQAEPQGGD